MWTETRREPQPNERAAAERNERTAAEPGRADGGDRSPGRRSIAGGGGAGGRRAAREAGEAAAAAESSGGVEWLEAGAYAMRYN
jgi:hypothetical protein